MLLKFPGLHPAGRQAGAGLLALLLATGSSLAKTPVQFDYTVLNVPGAVSTSVFGINQTGEIVGAFTDAAGSTHGFLGKVVLKKTADPLGGSHLLVDKTSAFTPLDPKDSFATEAHGINDQGQIVGEFGSAKGHHGFIYQGGRFTTLEPPKASASAATAINAAGQIVGQFDDDDGTHGFLRRGGVFSLINVPGATTLSVARGINAQGQIVGNFGNASGQHGFLRDHNIFTTIDPPFSTTGNTATAASATGINGRGQIVGFYLDDSGNQRAFLRDGADYTAIDFPGASATQAFGVNDAGYIVGQFSNAKGVHGFLAVPIVDRVPAAYVVLLWALGLGLVLAGLSRIMPKLRKKRGELPDTSKPV